MKIITIVCFANYCRSPVAEALLSDRLTSDYEIISAGLEPVVKSGMDERSSKFLDSIGLPKKVHVPKKINTQIMNNSTYVFALDTFILLELNITFPNQKGKIKLLTFQKPGTRLFDPYRMSNDDYLLCMENIRDVCNSLDI